jgi:cellulose synthase/poly-beta-1,6-N-acetylglucosamine synthase-like glycosyltransferase
MLRALLWVAETVTVALIIYNLVIAIAGWSQPLPAPEGERKQRFRVVVPAHNEEPVIGSTVEDLRGLAYPSERFMVWVLADRCTDQTAANARAAGAEVVERNDGPDGKGAALGWLLDRNPLTDGEALVVIDADNRAPPAFLARLSDEIEQGHQALQAYLDVSNPDENALTTASALSYWASNRMVQLARRNLGWTSDLGGTGMAITRDALSAAGGFGSTLVEDQELGVRLFIAGHPVVWLHDIRICDQKPSQTGVAMRQRSRWAAGRRQVARRWFSRLLSRRTAAAWDLALRLVQPSRMGIALLSALLASLSALGVPLWPWWVWAGLALIQFLAPIPFLVRDGVPRRYLIKYPLLVLLPLLKLPARFVRNRGWYHTPHRGD